MLVQTGVNHSVISYNYNVDIHELVDLSLHGHYSNHNLYEGNKFWWGGFADFWGQVGPKNTLYRNQVQGKAEGDQGVIVYDNSDSQNIIANDFLRNSTLEKDADVDDLYEEGNVIEGAPVWNTLSGSADLPPSLYLENAPDFWPADLPWPAYGPDVSGSDLNKIPAQLRYEDLIGIGPGPGDDNEKPNVEITAPTPGANLAAGSDVTVTATADDTDGTVVSVDFYIDGFWQGSDTEAPYTFEWQGILEGSYVLTAAATDNEGATRVSSEVAVSVSNQDGSEVYITSVTASGSREGAGPENTLDGRLSTKWAAYGDGAWIQYNLSASTQVTTMDIAWARGDTRKAYFDILLSVDGINWTPAAENMESSGVSDGLETYILTPSDALHIRIVGHGTSSNDWTMVSEVEAGFEALTPHIAGDATGNGTISASDAAIILEHTVGYLALEGQAYIAGDVTGNGEISALDASLVLQYITGLINCFPSEGSCTAGAIGTQEREDLFQLPRITHRP